MESAASLKGTLKVDWKLGSNWDEAALGRPPVQRCARRNPQNRPRFSEATRNPAFSRTETAKCFPEAELFWLAGGPIGLRKCARPLSSLSGQTPGTPAGPSWPRVCR